MSEEYNKDRRNRDLLIASLAAITADQREPLVLLDEWRKEASEYGVKGNAFDNAAWELYRLERITLHHHDHPDSMSPKLRKASLKKNNYYFHAASLRE